MSGTELFAGRRVGVLGLGKSGQAAARYLARRGAAVRGSDSKPEAELGEVPALLRQDGVEVECGGHTWRHLEGCEFLVVSPGIPMEHPVLVEAARRGIPVIGEVELAHRVSSAPIVAVTGTNGKSTTTSLIGHLAQALGQQAVVAGNIGTPLLDLIDQVTPRHLVVMEVSSFQLETIDLFRPNVAVFLNLTPDHLNRHPTLDAYLEAKMRLFENQDSSDVAVLNHADPVVRRAADRIPSRILWFSRSESVRPGVSPAEGKVMLNLDEGMKIVANRSDFPLPGEHNTDNVLAATAVLAALRIPLENLPRALASFRGLPHRLERVAEIAGVRYYDDSKGTNPGATAEALTSFDGPVILIAGGSDKGVDLSPVAAAGRGRVKALLGIGETAPALLALFDDLPGGSRERCGSLAEAVERARAAAAPGDTVLLSPACASFDMFRNAEDRGEQFQALVKRMAARRSNEVTPR